MRKDQINALVEGLGFNVADLATLAGVGVRVISRLKYDGRFGLPDRLDDLRAIAERMLTDCGAEPAAIAPWFISSNPFLGHERPIDVLRVGRFEDVLEAVYEEPLGFEPISKGMRHGKLGSALLADMKSVEFGWMQIHDLTGKEVGTYQYESFLQFKGGEKIEGSGASTPIFESSVCLGVGYAGAGSIFGFIVNERMTRVEEVVHFQPVDDFDTSGETISIIRDGGSDGCSCLRPDELLPDVYASFRVESVSDRIASGRRVLGVVAGPSRPAHLKLVLDHTAIQARVQGLM